MLFDHPDSDPFNDVEFDRPYLPCDYNNDGYVDFVGKRGFNEQLILKGTAVDTFQEINILPMGSPSSQDIFEVLDFDQDGDLDFVAETYLLLNEGNDQFTRIALDLASGSGLSEFIIGVADFNDDDLLDLLVLRDEFFEDTQVSILTNNGDNTFDRCLLHTSEDDIGDTEIADIDQDDDLDIIMGSDEDNGKILLFKNDGECTFALSEMIYNGYLPISERSVEVADMNDDQKLDIVVIAFSSVFIFENTDDFVSEPPFTTVETDWTSFFDLADFNNDGLPDIAIVTRQGNFRVRFAENLGNMNFSEVQLAATFAPAPAHGLPDFNYLEQNMSFYDYNDDGLLDIIYTSGFGSNNVSLVPNITTIVDVEDVFAEAVELKLFPNPASTEINVTLLEINLTETASYQVVNMQGQLVKRGPFTSTKIDVSDLPKGQYSLLLTIGEELHRGRFIKVN